jgi:cyclic di-GMP phosphodiesterase
MKTSKPKILIVDDSKEQIRLLYDILEHQYTLITATNGEKAIRLAMKEPKPDLILLDILLSDISGYEVCNRLKLEERTNHIPIILLSGIDSEENELKGLSAGAIDYIRKPFKVAIVSTRIKNLLEFKKHQNNLNEKILNRTKELKMTQALLIESLGSLAEYRDPETGGHIRRSQNYVKALAKALMNNPDSHEQLNTEDIELLHQSAPLHDIGKVAIPDNILLKPGKLDDKEFSEMKNHCQYGHTMLMKTMHKLPDKSFLRYTMEIAITHHEKWDGTGYPKGLKGRNIPLSGRLMALADVYDALISKRCYKLPFSHEKAVEIIREESGRQFDPDIVTAFLELEMTFRNIAYTYADYEEEREMLGFGATIKSGSGKYNINKILLVEDNEINLEIMKNQIESLGYLVGKAINGEDALEELKCDDYDLVMSDLEMPVIDGYQLVKTLHRISPEMPVIAVTASDYDMTPGQLQDLGFCGYLLKPFDDVVLKNMLTNL